jgi:hypothetical protein
VCRSDRSICQLAMIGDSLWHRRQYTIVPRFRGQLPDEVDRKSSKSATYSRDDGTQDGRRGMKEGRKVFLRLCRAENALKWTVQHHAPRLEEGARREID